MLNAAQVLDLGKNPLSPWLRLENLTHLTCGMDNLDFGKYTATFQPQMLPALQSLVYTNIDSDAKEVESAFAQLQDFQVGALHINCKLPGKQPAREQLGLFDTFCQRTLEALHMPAVLHDLA